MTDPTNGGPLKPQRQISPGRKGVYYTGMVLAALGAVSFASTFCTFALHFGDFDNFESNARSDILRAVGGMFLMSLGIVLMGVGRAGFAGSGVVLDPRKAREDLEPWNRMQGGMVNDTLSEIDAVNKVTDAIADKGEGKEVAKVRCPRCRALNEETANYCNSCGAPLAG